MQEQVICVLTIVWELKMAFGNLNRNVCLTLMCLSYTNLYLLHKWKVSKDVE